MELLDSDGDGVVSRQELLAASAVLGVAPEQGETAVNLGTHGCNTASGLSSWEITATDRNVDSGGVGMWKFRVPVDDCTSARYAPSKLKISIE